MSFIDVPSYKLKEAEEKLRECNLVQTQQQSTNQEPALSSGRQATMDDSQRLQLAEKALMNAYNAGDTQGSRTKLFWTIPIKISDVLFQKNRG